MFEAGDEVNMLALETSKSHHLPSRKSGQVDRDRYISKKGVKADKHFDNVLSSDYESLRDGAVNRTIESSGLIKKTKRSSKLDASWKSSFKQEVARGIKDKYSAFSNPVTNEVVLLKEEDFPGLKKKSRVSVVRKGVLKGGEGHPDKDNKSNRLRQQKEVNNLYNGNIIQRERSPGRNDIMRFGRDSSSLSDYTSVSQSERDERLKRLTTANRPKSAGQAMYLTEELSDSDDSFYEGEVEVVDLDDPVFAFEREFEEAREARIANRPPGAAHDTSTENSGNASDLRIRYHDDTENTSKQVLPPTESEQELNNMRPKSDRNYDAAQETRPTTSRGRRRVRSETELSRTSMIPRRVENHKPKQGLYKDKRLPEPLGSERMYNNSVDKVISKYSGLSVKKNGSSYPTQMNVKQDPHFTRARAPFPRKLKPILRREKLGQSINTTAKDKIDYDW